MEFTAQHFTREQPAESRSATDQIASDLTSSYRPKAALHPIAPKSLQFRQAGGYFASGRKAFVVGVELIGMIVQCVVMRVIVWIETIAAVIIADV